MHKWLASSHLSYKILILLFMAYFTSKVYARFFPLPELLKSLPN